MGPFRKLIERIKPAIARTRGQPEWPFLAGHYRICSRSAPVVVVLPRDGRLAGELAALAPEGLCMIAELAAPKDIATLLRNLSSNLAIEYVVLANGAADKHRLLAGTHRLLDEKARTELPKETEAAIHRIRNEIADELGALRTQVKAIDLSSIAEAEQLQARIEEITSAAKRQTTGFVAPESDDSAEIERVIAVRGVTYRQTLDKAGDYAIALQGRNIVVTHSNRKGVPLRTVEGTTARDIYLTLIHNGWITKLDHAAYLGAELARAEIALRTGMAYAQTTPGADEE